MKPIRIFGVRLPGLHSIHWKVFVFHMAVLILPLGYLAYRAANSIETSYMHATEEGMIDTASVIAELYANVSGQTGAESSRLVRELGDAFARLPTTYPVEAKLFGFFRTAAETRLLLYDRGGILIFDSSRQILPGTDRSGLADVRKALKGKYGARWELDESPRRVNLYSTLPATLHGEIVGVVSVSKSTDRIRYFIFRALFRLLLPGLLALAVATALAYALSAYITRIIWSLAASAERIAEGEPNVRLETWTRSELGVLARAVEKMRERLEGKAYVEHTVTTLSHELKTPLAAIRGAAEVLEDGAIEDPAARTKFLRNIQSEVARLEQIVRRLLELARLESRPAADAPAAQDCVPALNGILDVYAERAAAAGLRMYRELPREPLLVRIEAGQFRQLIEPLLDNAIQFTPAGRGIRVSACASGKTASFQVSDEGEGIEPDLLPKIFDRFFTTENPRTGNRGTGLGLAIAQSIAGAHGGSIEVESERGKGSTFTVWLPV